MKLESFRPEGWAILESDEGDTVTFTRDINGSLVSLICRDLSDTSGCISSETQILNAGFVRRLVQTNTDKVQSDLIREAEYWEDRLSV